ncbi:MAG: hypothetical protein RIS36_1169 [Pseudomonadota bacterium]
MTSPLSSLVVRYRTYSAKRMVGLVCLVLAPVLGWASPLDLPDGVGPLPDLQAGAKTGALVTKGYIDKYRALIPPELAELVDRSEFAFEAVSRPKSGDLFGEAQSASSSQYSVDDRGALLPPPVSAVGLFFSVPESEGEYIDPKSFGWRILWNTTVAQWRLRSFTAATSLVTFSAGTNEGRRVDFSVSRIYPPALGQSPGTLKPMFREKISAVTPQPLLGLTWLTLRFLGASPDYMWAASPINGQVRQMTGSNRADSIFAGAFSPDDLFVWSGKVEGVEPSSVRLVKMLVPVVEGAPTTQATHSESCGITDFSKTSPIDLNLVTQRFPDLPGWIPTNVRMTLRPLWRVEMKTRDPFSLDARQTLYVDAQTMLPVYRVIWEQDGRMKKFVMGIIGRVPTGEGSGPGWRGQITVAPGAANRSVLSLQRLETCSQLTPGNTIIDFDPSSIGSKLVKVKATPTPEPELEAEPVDE